MYISLVLFYFNDLKVSIPTKPKKPVLIGEWDVYFYNPEEMVIFQRLINI